MSNTAISVKSLSKLFRIGAREKRHDSLVQSFLHSLRAPFRNYRQLRQLTRFESDDETVFWALRDITFEVKRGEVLGIIGHNGAGKSTLLKILSRITEPTSGEVLLHGRVSSLLEVGTGFHPDLTGRENVYMNGTILGMTKREIDQRFDEIVDFSGIEKHLDTPVKFYSTGMKVRLGFSVAAHLEPEILIIDEVLAVGDAEFQRKCLGKMQAVSGEGRTILFVSHNMLAVKSLCRTGIWLDNGRVSETGAIETVIDSYLSKVNQNRASFIILGVESEGFRIHSLNISNNGIDGNFNIKQDLFFDIKVSSDKDYESININLFFNTMDGIVIFAVCSPSERFIKGEYSFQCTVPAKTLNDIIYTIDLMVVADGPKILHHLKEVVSIEGVEDKREGAWLGKFPGLIRPETFNWNKIGAQ